MSLSMLSCTVRLRILDVQSKVVFGGGGYTVAIFKIYDVNTGKM